MSNHKQLKLFFINIYFAFTFAFSGCGWSAKPYKPNAQPLYSVAKYQCVYVADFEDKSNGESSQIVVNDNIQRLSNYIALELKYKQIFNSVLRSGDVPSDSLIIKGEILHRDLSEQVLAAATGKNSGDSTFVAHVRFIDADTKVEIGQFILNKEEIDAKGTVLHFLEKGAKVVVGCLTKSR